MIRFVSHSEIDFVKYDECIENSMQGTVYAMSWYLDAVFPDWSAYVVGDYDVVMPIPLKQKFGIKYALQPQFCQQLGIFSKSWLSKLQAKELLGKLPFLYSLCFNSGNVDFCNEKILRPNYVLDLSEEYAVLLGRFSMQCRRNIKKATGYTQIVGTMQKDDYLSFLTENAGSWMGKVQIPILTRLIDKAFSAGCAEILAVCDENSQALAAVFFLKWRNRMYYLSPVSSEQGKQWQSMTFLLNDIIERNANSSLLIDFEGSAIESIRNFYTGFGAQNEPYPLISKNTWMLKLARR
ncbi:MAG: hypothetical protein IK025_04115 [Bacteroidales bacterium]|nr:hypothetical protein [Bacteroidales bacterium]